MLWLSDSRLLTDSVCGVLSFTPVGEEPSSSVGHPVMQRGALHACWLLTCIFELVFPMEGFPGGSPIKNMLASTGDVSLVPELRKSPGEGNSNPLQYSCLGNPMDGGAWWAAVHGVAKSRTRLNDFTFTFHFPALEKEMATHSSVLAWWIPGTAEPGGLSSMGWHRVGPHRPVYVCVYIFILVTLINKLYSIKQT